MPTIFDKFVVVKPSMEMDELQVSPELYGNLDRDYDGFKSHSLISAHNFTESWSTWEIHPHGDEMVLLISGSARLILKTESGEKSVVLEGPGSYVVVPKNTWHTAEVEKAASLLFITPGEGTRNAESPPADS